MTKTVVVPFYTFFLHFSHYSILKQDRHCVDLWIRDLLLALKSYDDIDEYQINTHTYQVPTI